MQLSSQRDRGSRCRVGLLFGYDGSRIANRSVGSFRLACAGIDRKFGEKGGAVKHLLSCSLFAIGVGVVLDMNICFGLACNQLSLTFIIVCCDHEG